MFRVPEKYRLTPEQNRMMGSDHRAGNNGVFIVQMGGGIIAFCIASDGMGWEHVSIRISENNVDETPTWEEMCKIKNLFWSPEDTVLQYHPPASEYVNNHENVLHLWRPVGVVCPRPPAVLVGRVETCLPPSVGILDHAIEVKE